MNKTTTCLSIVILALCFVLGATMQGKAQTKGFAGVLPFITGNNRMGFFDQNNGKVYLYDDNFSLCTFVGQIQELGQPILTLPKS